MNNELNELLITIGDHSARINALEEKSGIHDCLQNPRLCKLEQNYELNFAMVAKVQSDLTDLKKDIYSYKIEATKAIDEAKSGKYVTIWACIGVVISIFISMLGFYIVSSSKVFDQFNQISKDMTNIQKQIYKIESR